MDDGSGFLGFLLFAAFIVIVPLAMRSCTDADRTVSTLEAQGFTEVEPGGYTYFGCGHGDVFHTEFTATNANGNAVSGIVCCGWLKSCTVRF